MLSADGVGTNAIMAATGTSKTCVWRWQGRFMIEGVEGLLRDKTRPSGIPKTPNGKVAEVLRLTQEATPHEETYWTIRAMGQAVGLAASTVWGIWKSHELNPHRWRHFKLSNDRAFVEKLRDVVGLYVAGRHRAHRCRAQHQRGEALRLARRSRRDHRRQKSTVPKVGFNPLGTIALTVPTRKLRLLAPELAVAEADTICSPTRLRLTGSVPKDTTIVTGIATLLATGTVLETGTSIALGTCE